MAHYLSDEEKELTALCDSVKHLAGEGAYSECEKLIAEAMRKHPHAPQPHNLMGVLLEIKDDRTAAMKHFRAAWALDPTYIPARYNLDNYASFYSRGKCAFNENDCQAGGNDSYTLEYDGRGVGYLKKGEEL